MPDRMCRSGLDAIWNLASNAMVPSMVHASSCSIIVVCELCDVKVRFKGTARPRAANPGYGQASSLSMHSEQTPRSQTHGKVEFKCPIS